jgi:hypothetical protein
MCILKKPERKWEKATDEKKSQNYIRRKYLNGLKEENYRKNTGKIYLNLRKVKKILVW